MLISLGKYYDLTGIFFKRVLTDDLPRATSILELFSNDTGKIRRGLD